jgi:hypothetical protein
MLVLLPTNMTSNVVSDLIWQEKAYNCAEKPVDQGALRAKIAEVLGSATSFRVFRACAHVTRS